MNVLETRIGTEIITFTSKEISVVETIPDLDIYTITTAGQKLVISNPQILIYNRGVYHSNFIPGYKSLFQATINENFVNDKTSLIFFDDERVVKIFCGDDCGIKSVNGKIIEFYVDDYSVISVGLRYLVINKRKEENNV